MVISRSPHSHCEKTLGRIGIQRASCDGKSKVIFLNVQISHYLDSDCKEHFVFVALNGDWYSVSNTNFRSLCICNLMV